MSLGGWSDASYGSQSANGKCHFGFVIDLMSASLSGPREVLRRISKFTRKEVKSIVGGEVHALSEMVDHMA